MILLLSGASHPNAEQRDVMASTGGYISSTTVPNGKVNALFDDLSCYSHEKKIEEVVGIFLRNDTDQTVNNVIIQQIYHNDFGTESKTVKFEFAAVEPKDNQLIEKTGNRRNFPYNAEFFTPTAKREFALLEITKGGQSGDVLDVLGVNVFLTGKTKIDVVMSIVEAFEDNLDFTVEAKDEETVFFERKRLVFTGDPISILTPGNAKAKPVNFSAGFDDGILLIEELEPGDSLGIWIKRSVRKMKKTKCTELEERYDEYFGKEFSEGRIEDHVDNEENHEVIFNWD